MGKKYYGFRYYSRRRTATGEPNTHTGRKNIAGDLIVFFSKNDLNNWMCGEKLTAPSGYGGGERVQLTKKETRKHYLGESKEDFNDIMKYSEFIFYKIYED